ncbi:hypothetical protein K443DRAFT_2137 [Laccaria amethystina LaAM-08-1]|uniref:Uncharacterized protein n=1 Tax=Laccaria amethystina LaAM-08-1 TaxID=1095629 RepID=A0A0C9YHU8_9AGAR|nr:hypothetical protein K443DRAFT_2137 [Laccaria amethystina LaAM-08-1]
MAWAAPTDPHPVEFKGGAHVPSTLALHYPSPRIGTSCRVSELCNTTSTAPFTPHSAIFLKNCEILVNEVLKPFEDVHIPIPYVYPPFLPI